MSGTHNPLTGIMNDIFLNIEFTNKLLALIPTEVLEYWKIEIIDANRITGGIRYDEHDTIDAIYIYIKTKFMEIDSKIPRGMIKFNAEKDTFVFDSVYSQYDPIDGKIIFPSEEYRYDSNMNIIGKYSFFKREKADDELICVQYKNDEKLKEYFITNEKISAKKLDELESSGIITRKNKSTEDVLISCVNVYGKNIKHYHIR